MSLPASVESLLLNPPAAGQGVHVWGFAAACALRRARLPDSEVERCLWAAASRAGRKISEREFRDWLAGSSRAVMGRCPRQSWGSAPRAIVSPRLGPDLDRLRDVWRDGPGCADLWEMSPVRLLDDGPSAEQLVDLLLPGDGSQLICCGWTSYSFDTRSRNEWRGELGSMQLIVPGLMIARKGPTTNGTLSAHAKSIVEPDRRWMVFECDFKTDDSPLGKLVEEVMSDGRTPADLCAAVLMKLATAWPLACVVHSGGKSLHGWFPLRSTEDVIAAFSRLGVEYGADPVPIRNNAQFVRMPEGRRQPGGVRQALLYLNSTVLGE